MRTRGDVRAQLLDQLRLHVRLRSYRLRLARAKENIERALGIGPCAVAVSGGKDSTVVLDLARQIDPAIEGFFFDSGCETEWTLETVDALDRLHPMTTIHPRATIIEMSQEVGAFGYEGPERLAGDWHHLPRDYRRVLIEEPAAEARRLVAEATGREPVVMLLGLRSEESRGRRMNRRFHGTLYQRKDGSWIGTPIADWSGRDVLAYLLTHDLPVSAEYLQPGEELDERARRRTGTVLGTTCTERGRWQRLRMEHPQLWQRLTREFPDMRLWG